MSRGGAISGGLSGAGAVPVAVIWSESQRRPVAFVWRRQRYKVERVLETWVIETGWWRNDGRVNHSYWRVRAGGRVFDLRYDRDARTWTLVQALT
jgi:hypothetical protein